jgi:hypothetical protein
MHTTASPKFGLKLQAAREESDTFVIDHAEQSSEN